MLKLHKIKALPILLVIALLAGSVYIGGAQAATITVLSDTMSNQTISEGSDHTIVFTLSSTGALTDDDTITLTFPAGFVLTSITEDDVDVSGSTLGEATTAADCTGAEHMSVAVSGQNLVLTICNGDGGDLANSETVTIEIGTVATASGTGANQITNPGTDGSYLIEIATTATDPDTGSFAVPILDNDTVTVTATVDPTISFYIYETTTTTPTSSCDLGTLTLGGTNEECDYDIVAATNATGGLVISAVADVATLTNASNDTITAVSVAVGAITGEGYGIYHDAISGSNPLFTNSGNLGDTATQTTASANYASIGTSSVDLFESTGPVNESRVTITHVAEIDATTPAGAYTQAITYTAVGTF